MVKKSNEQVLAQVNEDRSLFKMTGRRRAKLIGHMLQQNQFLSHIFEGKPLGGGTKRRVFQRNAKGDELPIVLRFKEDNDGEKDKGWTLDDDDDGNECC